MNDHSGFKALGNIDMNNKELQNLAGLLGSLITPWNDEGLVLYLPFSGNEGQIAKDASFYKNDGVFKGAGEPAWCEGRRGPAVDFDGANDYINCGNDNSLNSIGTVEAWINTDIHDTLQFIIMKKQAAGGGNYWLLYVKNSDNITFGIYGNLGSEISTAVDTITPGTWHHIVGVYDGSYLSIYIDGVLKAGPTALIAGDYSNPDDCVIGFHPNLISGPFDGKIDEVRIYNRAISANEVKMHYLRSYSAGIREYISRIRAYRVTTDQVIGTGAWTKVEFNAESYDKQGEYDHVTNFRFTAQKAGKYLITAQVRWNLSVDQSTHYISIYKNGAAVGYAAIKSSGTTLFSQAITDILNLSVNDYIEIYVNQNTGGNVNIKADTTWTFLAVHKLSD